MGDAVIVGDAVTHPLAALLRRYAYAYTAAHDFRVCHEIMVDDYVLRMGEHEVRGRDEAYIPATERQFRQFPTLGFTVHDLVLGHDRAALHFSEHGRSALHGGGAAWSGISLYRWDGERLVECRVEQDYHGRREQQRTQRPHPVLAPGLDPWSATAAPPGDGTEETVRRWLKAGGLADAPPGSLDDEHCAPAHRVQLADADVTVLDLFGAGDRVAFHIRTTGHYLGGLAGLDEHRGVRATLYATGLATVDGGVVRRVRAITDRLAAARRLSPAPPR